MNGTDPTPAATVASAVVALVALFVACWTAFVQRRHSRLSVRPHLDFIYGRPAGGGLALHLVNNGIGPAQIDAFRVSIKGASVQAQRRLGLWPTAFSLVGSYAPASAYAPSVGQHLSPGQELLLLDGGYEVSSAKTTKDAVAAASDFENALEQMSISVRYKSLYGEDFECTWSLLHSDA